MFLSTEPNGPTIKLKLTKYNKCSLEGNQNIAGREYNIFFFFSLCINHDHSSSRTRCNRDSSYCFFKYFFCVLIISSRLYSFFIETRWSTIQFLFFVSNTYCNRCNTDSKTKNMNRFSATNDWYVYESREKVEWKENVQ